MSFMPIHAGEYLRDELNARKWTQHKFAQESELSPRTISLIVREIHAITPLESIRIGKALGVFEDLFYKLQCQYNRDIMIASGQIRN